jgi:hypothetical protein
MAIDQINISTPSNLIEFTDTAMGAIVDGIKSSSAKVYSVVADNSLNVLPSYVKLYNVGSGGVTVGTTSSDEVILVPASSLVTVVYFTGASPGKVFGTALSAACTTAGGTGGSSSPASSVVVSISYV